MTILMRRMREELVRRTYSETTIRSYLHAVEAFRHRGIQQPGQWFDLNMRVTPGSRRRTENPGAL